MSNVESGRGSMTAITLLQTPEPRELSPTEKALVQALISAIVRELKAEKLASEAA